MSKISACCVIVALLVIVNVDFSYAQTSTATSSASAPAPVQLQQPNLAPYNLAPTTPAPSNPGAYSTQVPESVAPIPTFHQDSPIVQSVERSIKHREQQTSSALESWIGADINKFIMTWGAPSSEYRMPNGNVIYTWHDEHFLSSPVDIIDMSCTVSIYVDLHGRIFSWRWQGNGC